MAHREGLFLRVCPVAGQSPLQDCQGRVIAGLAQIQPYEVSDFGHITLRTRVEFHHANIHNFQTARSPTQAAMATANTKSSWSRSRQDSKVSFALVVTLTRKVSSSLTSTVAIGSCRATCNRRD